MAIREKLKQFLKEKASEVRPSNSEHALNLEAFLKFHFIEEDMEVARKAFTPWAPDGRFPVAPEGRRYWQVSWKELETHFPGEVGGLKAMRLLLNGQGCRIVTPLEIGQFLFLGTCESPWRLDSISPLEQTIAVDDGPTRPKVYLFERPRLLAIGCGGMYQFGVEDECCVEHKKVTMLTVTEA